MQKTIGRKEAGDRDMAQGLDTQARIPVLAALFEMFSMLFLPWVSAPGLKYSPYPSTSSLWTLPGFPEGIAWRYGVPDAVSETALRWAGWLKIAAVAAAGLSLLFIIAAYRGKVKAVRLGRFVFLINALIPAAVFAWILDTNMMLNLLEGKENGFFALTIESHVQLTAAAYAQAAAAAVLIPALRSLLDTRREYGAKFYITRSGGKGRRMGRRTLFAFALVLAAVPAVILFGIFFLNDRSNYFISLCIIILSMIPFFMVFEDRRPQAREVVVIAAMAGLGVAARVAFFMMPQFKPAAAVVVISGVCLGGEAGFLTGALVGFVSNFFFGQGPWTPWQMFAYGMIGFLAGLIFRNKRGAWRHFRLWVCVYGGLSVLILYGFLLDTASLFNGMAKISKAAFRAILISGLPLNLLHGTATVAFLALLGEPMMKKLERIKMKYGILEP